jgi:signal transduction histidine kinase
VLRRSSTEGLRWRPSAALVLGVLSGTLAAVTVLPTIVPLTWRVVATEDAAAQRHVDIAVRAVARNASAISAEDTSALLVDGVASLDAQGSTLASFGRLPSPDAVRAACASDAGVSIVHDGATRWALACRSVGEQRVVATLRQANDSSAFVGWLVAGLAAMVGISTALGVLQVLQPLSVVTASLRRMEAGERGVRAERTGLTELDDMVAHLNAATRVMEDREDAILGRIEVVQHLARMVAHEIRNPLQSLELLASNLAEEDDRAEREQLAATIHGEVRALERVVVHLLRDAPGQAALRPSKAPTRLSELLSQVVTFRRGEARRRGAELTLGAVPEVVLHVDRALLLRAIENLVSNALQSVPNLAGAVRLWAEERAGEVRIHVDDNGPGVAEELGQTIYQPRVTTRPDGHGLGLAMVSGVMAAHEGRVDHQRSPLGGARFTCHLGMSGTATKEG